MLSLFLAGACAVLVVAVEPPAHALPESLATAFAPPAEFANDFGAFKSLLQRADGTRLQDAADWSRRRAEILAKWQALLGPWPPLLAQPQLDIVTQEDREEFTQHRVQIEMAPGRLSIAYLLIPHGPGPFPAVVVVFYEPETGIGHGKPMRDFALQLARRGMVTLSVGSEPESYYPDKEHARLQPLAYHAYEAANCRQALANLKQVDPERIGIVGHSYGGKWALFAACLHDKFACAAWSDPGIVFDESRPNVNYWERWYLGFEPGEPDRTPGLPSAANPRTGPYKKLIEAGADLHELHALMAPRPLLVSGGSEDPPQRWKALNHAIAVNALLGQENRVAMTNRSGHDPTAESNAQLCDFFQFFLRPPAEKAGQ